MALRPQRAKEWKDFEDSLEIHWRFSWDCKGSCISVSLGADYGVGLDVIGVDVDVVVDVDVDVQSL